MISQDICTVSYVFCPAVCAASGITIFIASWFVPVFAGAVFKKIRIMSGEARKDPGGFRLRQTLQVSEK